MATLNPFHKYTKSQLLSLYHNANQAYYNDDEPLMTDQQYDDLQEFIATTYPDVPLTGHKDIYAGQQLQGREHTEAAARQKVKLPYEMWSLDKIKPDTDALDRWLTKYSAGSYVLSCKLDGISALFCTDAQAQPKMYTRGNGTFGQDISHLCAYLKLPLRKPNICIRGELIMPKTTFLAKYAQSFSNARNYVAGLIHHKNPDQYAAQLADISFVTYEVLYPEMTPHTQLLWLDSMGYQPVEFIKVDDKSKLTLDLLSTLFTKWRDDNMYKYDIDGVVCVHNQLHPRIPGQNPDHAFAFKMRLDDQMAQATVVEVIWTASKDGYLKPRVRLEPVNLCGVVIEYATGFNAKFIRDNIIGPGAIIELVRSGDVIPHIVRVLKPAATGEADMPQGNCSWTSTDVDLVLDNKADDAGVREKTAANFFHHLEVEGVGPGTVRKLFAAGYDTIPKIVLMNESDFLRVEGFQAVLAKKVHDNVRKQIALAPMPLLMYATNIFGRGYGIKKIQAMLETNSLPTQALEEFNRFLKNIHYSTINHSNPNDQTHAQQQHPTLKGKKFAFTGFRDKPFMAELQSLGMAEATSISKNTYILFVKDKESSHLTGKVKDAHTLGVRIMTVDEFKKEYTSI